MVICILLHTFTFEHEHFKTSLFWILCKKVSIYFGHFWHPWVPKANIHKKKYFSIQITQRKTIGFTDSYKRTILHELFYKFLDARHKQQLPLSSLLTGFYRFYGNKLYYRNFGFESFLDLIMSLDHETFKVIWFQIFSLDISNADNSKNNR